VLVAYAKITLKEDLLGSDLPDDEWFTRTLRDYFPARLVEQHADRFAGHPLHREIITTCLVNEMVNRGGITFAFRVQEETGAGADLVARAYTVCREVFSLRDYVRSVEALDTVLSTDAQTMLYLAFRRLLDRSVRWFLQSRSGRLDLGAEIERFAPVVAELGPKIPDLLVGAEHKSLVADAEKLTKKGVPPKLAMVGVSLLNVYQLLDITQIASATGVAPAEVAPLYFTLSERYAVDAMLVRISGLGRPDRWQALARAALRYDLYAALEALTVAVLSSTPAGRSPADRITAWEQANASAVSRATQTLEEVRRLEKGDLASLSVALRTLRGVVRSSA
jgi:glutamate dehydrogenase